MLICGTADALTPSALTSIPLTTTVTPPLPSDPASRNRETVAMTPDRRPASSRADSDRPEGIRVRGGARANLRAPIADRDFLFDVRQRQRDAHGDGARDATATRVVVRRKPSNRMPVIPTPSYVSNRKLPLKSIAVVWTMTLDVVKSATFACDSIAPVASTATPVTIRSAPRSGRRRRPHAHRWRMAWPTSQIRRRLAMRRDVLPSDRCR